MNFFKKSSVAMLSCSLIIASVTGYSTVSAVETGTTTAEAPAQILIADDTYPDDITATMSTSAPAENLTEIITTETSDITTDESFFNVFDIYDAHVNYISSTGPADTSHGVKGIDVSKWQGTIDWEKVKADGINFAIIRAGYGNELYQEDPYFDINMQNAEKAGVDRGIYWYSYASTIEEAYQEAEVCYEIIKEYKFEYPLMFDIEESFQERLSTATVSGIIDAFCSTMEEKGYYVSIYSYESFLKTKVYENILTKYDVAVAHFNVDKPNYSLPYGMWQYSSTGRVDGINGNVDLDYAYKDYPYIMSTYHKNGY